MLEKGGKNETWQVRIKKKIRQIGRETGKKMKREQERERTAKDEGDKKVK